MIRSYHSKREPRGAPDNAQPDSQARVRHIHIERRCRGMNSPSVMIWDNNAQTNMYPRTPPWDEER